MGIYELVASVFGGGVTGLLGTIVSKVADYKAKKLEAEMNVQKFAHEIEMRKADAAIMAQEWAARTKVAEVEAGAKVEAADAAAFAESFKLEPQRYSDGGKLTPTQEWAMVFLDVLRGIVRPGLTIYLCAITTVIYLQARALIGSGIAPEEAVGLLKTIVNTVLYLTVTVTCWWFGVRSKGKASA